MTNENYYSFNIIMIGDSAVGKSSILSKYTNLNINSYIATVDTVLFRTVAVLFKEIRDTAGQEKFNCITFGYYRKADGIMLVYDITNRLTFNSLEKWIKNIQEHSNQNVLKQIIGNKCDLERSREVRTDQAQKFAALNNIPFMETSVINNTNIDRAFEDMARKLFENVYTKEQLKETETKSKKDNLKHNPKSLTLSSKNKKKKPCC